MLRSAPHLRRGALLIRDPCKLWVPALRSNAKGRCTASGTRRHCNFAAQGRPAARSEPDADAALAGRAIALVVHRGRLDAGVDADIALRPPFEAEIADAPIGLALAGRGEGEALLQQHRVG